MSSREIVAEDSGRRKEALKVLNIFAGRKGSGGNGGGSSGSGKVASDPPDENANDRRSHHNQNRLSKGKKETAQKEIQDLVLREIHEVRKILPGFIDDHQLRLFSRLQYDLDSTQILLHDIFQRFLNIITRTANSQQSFSNVRRDTDTLVNTEDEGSNHPRDANIDASEQLHNMQNQSEERKLIAQGPRIPTPEQGSNRDRLDTSKSASIGDGRAPRKWVQNVDDVSSQQLESMHREIDRLKGENAKFSTGWRLASDRIKDLEFKHKEALDYQKKMEEHRLVGLNAQIEEKVRKDFLSQIQKLQTLLTVERQNVATEKSGRKTDHREYQSGIDKLERSQERAINDLENANFKDSQRRQQEFQKKLSEEKGSLEARIRYLEQEQDRVLKDATDQVDSERKQWEQAKSKLLKKHQEDKDDLQERLEAELHRETAKSLKEKEELNDTMDDLVAKHEEKIGRLTAKHSNDLKQLNSQVAEQRKALDTERAQLLDEIDEKEARLKKEAEEAEAQMKKKYDKMFTEVGERHENEKVQLRKDRDAYSAALLDRDKVRDKIEFLSDVQVTSKYHKLVKEVEDLARLEWKRDPDMEALVKSFSVQPNTLMRQLFQDTIWLVLHEFIFCSPFRIFGEEGKRLEAEWYEQCGEDAASDDNGCYIWPAPEVDTERWRFVTVKECRASLRKPVPSVYDDRVRLKIGYGKSREELRDKLSNRLGEVAIVEKKHKDVIEKLTQQAASMWLEFSMQHYRIVMAIKDPKVNSIKARLNQAQKSSVDLVIVPRLKSYGNSKGKDLKAEETIKTCEGETLSIGTQKTLRGAPSRRPSISQRN